MTQATYVHRKNRDGSIDSICKTCFATVAKVHDEVTLTQHERTHCCPSWILTAREERIPATHTEGPRLVRRPLKVNSK